jgi:hypothetical protein
VWVVTVDYQNRNVAVQRGDSRLVDLEKRLTEHMASARTAGELWAVTLVVDALTPGAALELAESLLIPTIVDCGLAGGRVERVQAVRTPNRQAWLASLEEEG